MFMIALDDDDDDDDADDDDEEEDDDDDGGGGSDGDDGDDVLHYSTFTIYYRSIYLFVSVYDSLGVKLVLAWCWVTNMCVCECMLY